MDKEIGPVAYMVILGIIGLVALVALVYLGDHPSTITH